LKPLENFYLTFYTQSAMSCVGPLQAVDPPLILFVHSEFRDGGLRAS